MTQRIVAVVPVRMGSSRLPGKTLLPICGKPLLGHLLDRLAHCKRLDCVIVATSDRPENDAIASYCLQRGTACFRGAEDDVMARLLGALQSQRAEIGVVCFGDAPLIDPKLVDEMVGHFIESVDYDFVGNDLKTTFPPGMEVEVFRVRALHDAESRTKDPAVREHGTLFIRQNPDIYRIRNIEASGALRRPELEIEVDCAEDMGVISHIVEHFGERSNYDLAEIIAVIDKTPHVKNANQHIPRRWKAYREDVIDTVPSAVGGGLVGRLPGQE